jgi:hypothetical protein
VEPGETANLQFEFAVPTAVKIARVYGFVENNYLTKGNQRRTGWLDAEFVTLAEVEATQNAP